LNLTKPQLQTIPNRQIVKKYEPLFAANDKETKDVKFENKSEFEMAKFSHFPDVRKKYFHQISNNNRVNTQIVIQLLQLR
jgi:hypothetical protein